MLATVSVFIKSIFVPVVHFSLEVAAFLLLICRSALYILDVVGGWF